jgi:hypothetical protein
MLVTGVEQLQIMADKRQYREVANLLEAVNQLIMNFKGSLSFSSSSSFSSFYFPFRYHHIPRLRELKVTVQGIKVPLV